MNNADLYEPYDPRSDEAKLIAEARERNAERDGFDRSTGFAAPPDCGIDGLLRTAVSAICSGIATRKRTPESSWECVAEGLAMLQDAELLLRRTPRPL